MERRAKLAGLDAPRDDKLQIDGNVSIDYSIAIETRERFKKLIESKGEDGEKVLIVENGDEKESAQEESEPDTSNK